MSHSLSLLCLCVLVLATGPRLAGAQEKFGPAEFHCVSAKQRAIANYCSEALHAWSAWEQGQDDAALDAELMEIAGQLAEEFTHAETRSLAAGVDCVEQTATAADLAAHVGGAVSEITAAINSGLDLDKNREARCGARLLRAAARKCSVLLGVESWHTALAPWGGIEGFRDFVRLIADWRFGRSWRFGRCPTDASREEVGAMVDAIRDDAVFHTVVSPVLDDTEFQPVSPVGTVEYEGRTLEPRCGFDDDPDYHFFVKRGSVNKVVMYYQGGGACWENLTCGLRVCKDGADPISDDPDNFSGGFGDLSNPENPFRDWNIVFVTYCTCDIHFGDIDQSYPPGLFANVNVSHRGFQNAKVAEKFAREHFLNPEVVFVTGSSAGGYGALFHGPLLHDIWKASDFKVLGDASNGVITPDFLENEFGNWNFEANLPPDIPGVSESINGGDGMVGYVEAVADFFPKTTWAHYTTAYDGGGGGQTGFYNVMLNDNNPIASLSWWEGSCAFNQVMEDQAVETFDRVPSNYRYYIGTGSQHTMYGSDKVYSDRSGGESQTIVDWVSDMIAYEPGRSAAGDWQNVSCDDCGIVLPGDPTPPTIPTDPFFDDGMGGSTIMCTEP